ncbi:MAG: hypothetical protein FWD26_06275 [Treponema sp.]|nr:hypothetical protein [Treponema sp.]
MEKPDDNRFKDEHSKKYLKWDNDVVGIIDEIKAVTFVEPTYNTVISMYTKGSKVWTSDQFSEFLAERIVSRDRRDIENILFRMGLSHFDVLKIAEITRGIHPKDLLWIANTRDEKLSSAVTEIFDSVFHQKIDAVGDTVDTPEGYNIKRYGVYNKQYGIYKQRINPLTTDVESEVAVYLLAKKLCVPCCPAYQIDKDTVFSAFLFDFSNEYIVHFRRFFDGTRGDNEYQNLIKVRPQYKDDIARVIILDFITRQDDRHLSNIAVKVTGQGESFYPLYDNGRSLFYEDTEEMVSNAIKDPKTNATTFGYTGTYFDYVQEITKERGGLKDLINLNITEIEVKDILVKANFKGYRLDGALSWIMKTIILLKQME